jgi:hypothetical protein
LVNPGSAVASLKIVPRTKHLVIYWLEQQQQREKKSSSHDSSIYLYTIHNTDTEKRRQFWLAEKGNVIMVSCWSVNARLEIISTIVDGKIYFFWFKMNPNHSIILQGIACRIISTNLNRF